MRDWLRRSRWRARGKALGTANWITIVAVRLRVPGSSKVIGLSPRHNFPTFGVACAREASRYPHDRHARWTARSLAECSIHAKDLGGKPAGPTNWRFRPHSPGRECQLSGRRNQTVLGPSGPPPTLSDYREPAVTDPRAVVIVSRLDCFLGVRRHIHKATRLPSMTNRSCRGPSRHHAPVGPPHPEGGIASY
jgi:hypothetical protein